MMKQSCKPLMALSLFAMLATGLVVAQSFNGPMVVRVPFEFKAGGQTLPAGEYRVLRVHQSVVRLEDASGRGLLHLISNAKRAKSAPEEGMLVFHRYSDRYFLAEVWMAGREDGQALPVGHEEKEIARNQKLVETSLLVRR